MEFIQALFFQIGWYEQQGMNKRWKEDTFIYNVRR